MPLLSLSSRGSGNSVGFLGGGGEGGRVRDSVQMHTSSNVACQCRDRTFCPIPGHSLSLELHSQQPCANCSHPRGAVRSWQEPPGPPTNYLRGLCAESRASSPRTAAETGSEPGGHWQRGSSTRHSRKVGSSLSDDTRSTLARAVPNEEARAFLSSSPPANTA